MKNRKFELESYSVAIQGKNVPITEGIENYVKEKLSKIEKFADHILDVVVTLEVQKLVHHVHIEMKFLHFKINVDAKTDDLYSAIDKASDKLYNLITKYKNKLQSHHRWQNLATVDMNVHVLAPPSEVDEINDQIDEENLKKKEDLYKIHNVVSKDKMPLKTLTQEEAIMKMELSGGAFLLYRAEEDVKKGLRLIYRREDDEFGVVEIE